MPPHRRGPADRAIAGAVVDPETGCYAVLRKSTPDPTLRVARGGVWGDGGGGV